MRREFSRAVKVEIIKRATLNCEKCGGRAIGFEIDHRNPDGMQIDKSRPLTADDGWLLCIPCHRKKTQTDVANIAKAKRIEARHLGAEKPNKTKIPHRKKERGPSRECAGVPALMRRGWGSAI